MDHVYLLHHVREDDELREDTKLIGVYRTKHIAEEAVIRLSSQPGFLDYPQGFEIDEIRLDEDHWKEGFVRLIVVLMPINEGGTEAWRPVEAQLLRHNQYEIIGPMPDDEVWRYRPGSIVRCEVQQRSGGEALVVMALAQFLGDR